ncbi:MBL fold metallo-hydrolase [soil metagenome]
MMSHVRISLAALATALLAAQAGAAPVPIGPAAETVQMGAVTVTALRDMLNVVPNDGSVFGKDVGPAPVAKALADAGAPTDNITLGVDSLLVRSAGRTVLIDTGLGPKVGGALMASLAGAGVKPDAITDVLITHSHGDHVGGLVTAAGALAFPHATIRMSAEEWAWMQKSGNAALVTAIAPKVQAFRLGATIVPGIVAFAIPGHTPGHVGYRIGSGERQLVDVGDVAHSTIVSLGHPAWIISYDTDGIVGRQSREAWLARLAATKQRVFSPHFPFPGIGRIVKRGSGYAWQPDTAAIGS